jgi:hypothetical protein
MLKITLTPQQVQDPTIMPLAILATVLGTNPEWSNGRVTYKFDDYGIGMVPAGVLEHIIDIGGEVSGIAMWVEVTDVQLLADVPGNFPCRTKINENAEEQVRKLSEYCNIEVGIKGKHLASVGYKNSEGVMEAPDNATVNRMKNAYGPVVMLQALDQWVTDNTIPE